MKKRAILFASTCAAVAAVALVVLWPASAQTTGLLSDHALIDQTGGDTSVRCRTTNGEAFDVHATMRAFGGPVTMRVGFQDGDFIDYQLAQDETLSCRLPGRRGMSTGASGSRRWEEPALSWAG